MAFLITLLKSTDPTWDTYGTSIASGWEVALAIITASVPGMKPLFDKIFPRVFPTTAAGSSGTNVYELSTSGHGTTGFVSLGKSKKNGDGESTRGIKVDYEYQVRSDAEN